MNRHVLAYGTTNQILWPPSQNFFSGTPQDMGTKPTQQAENNIHAHPDSQKISGNCRICDKLPSQLWYWVPATKNSLY